MKLPLVEVWADWIINRMSNRQPDFVIGRDEPYLRRWWVIPRNRFVNIYLHNILSDDPSALHDHPWTNCSIILKTGYCEQLPLYPDRWPENRSTITIRRWPGEIVFRSKATACHRLMLCLDYEGAPLSAWTLFITGPVEREWGFWCSWGWRPWREFVSISDDGRGNSIDRGCD